MKVSSTNPTRKPTRLKGFDYSTPGAYFVTIVAHDRTDWFGTVENGQMTLSEEGRIVRQAWFDLPRHYANVGLDEDDFVIMPNHVHGIIVLSYAAISAGNPLICDLTEAIRAFKSFSARRINQRRGISGVPVWQRSFYERILRDDGEWDRARKYILQNPQNWQDDQENVYGDRRGGSAQN
jgi:putative transposase